MVRSARSDALRKRHRARFAKTKSACHLCGRPIDYELRWPDRMCFVVDHIVAIANGGSDDFENKAASHAACNAAKKDKQYESLVKRSGTLE
ncbi:MAG: HNH endonuclease [Microbacterium sp.]